MGHKALGLVAVVIFVGMQPQLACGMHCAFFAHRDSAGHGMDMSAHSPFPACHHELSVVSGHAPVLSDVASAPPAARVRVLLPRAPVHFTGLASPATVPGAFFEPECPPPRA